MADSRFDLDAYFARIGYTGPTEPTLPALQALVAHQSAAIAFENIDPISGRPPALDLASLQAKMVAGQRGGYCFEQNTLLKGALDTIGFRTTGLIARVCRRLPPGMVLPRSHMILRVDLPEGAYLADSGFGGLTPTAPLAMTIGTEQPTPNEVFRLVPHENETLLQALLGSEWDSIYHFTPLEQLPIDYVVANWFTATVPGSLFTSNLIVTRPAPGTRMVLFNRHFSIRSGDSIIRRVLTTQSELHAVLADTFGLSVADADMAAIERTLTQQDANAGVPAVFS